MSSSIFSSTVPRQTNLWTSTFFVCPMRNARSVAWFSTAGFHQRSKCTTCEAAVRLSPEPPALSDSTKNGTDSSSWKRLTSSLRFFTSVSPCSTSPGRPNTPPRNDASGAVTSRNWVKTSAFSCLAAITSHELAQARPLAAVVLGPGAVAQPLRRVVADLLEAHEEGEHQPLALDALGVLELLGQLLDGLLVERGLLAAELAEGLDLGLVGQIGDDGLVGLEAPQDVGPHQVAQRAVGVVRLVREALGVARELPGRAEQPRVEEVEDRPQVAEPVLDRACR